MSPLSHLRILVPLVLALLFVDQPLSLAQTIDELKAGVVKITATIGEQKRIGTGFIVTIEDDTAYIVTASHVVEGAVLTVKFYPKPDVKYPGEVKEMDGGNPKGLAVVLVQGSLPKGIRPLPLGSSVTIKGGEPITLVGFPRLIGVPWAIASGIIAGQKGLDLIITGSAVQEGNSGGPILLNGSVVGVLTEIQKDFGYGVPSSITQIALKGWGVRVEQGSSQADRVVPSTSEKLGEKTVPLPQEITGKDGAPMVRIPKGLFLYGEERRRETIDHDYWIDIYPVTNEKYRAFIEANGYKKTEYWSEQGWKWKTKENVTTPEYWNDPKWNKPDHPVVGVSYYEAEAYARWAGKRLPTEQEWEKAARGTDGRKYPWGYEFDENKSNSNSGGTTPVTRYPSGVSPYGVYDMAGNVWEWCASWYGEKHDKRVIRGGSWLYDPGHLRTSTRDGLAADLRLNDIGFRLAQDAP
jgi:formylglycine-generating enzyme required for sulfatase activity